MNRSTLILSVATIVTSSLFAAVPQAFARGELETVNRAQGEEMMSETDTGKVERATLGGGCFWCVEAVYERIEGVHSAVSGYAGGNVTNPSYKQVTTGKTGHAEVVQISFDPDKVSYEQILKVFWKAHDPTTLNRQGADVGTQYRSTILYEDETQKAIAEKSMQEAAADFDGPIVTRIEPLGEFYVAEDYHQDYFDNNSKAGYCQVVIQPKLEKLGLVGAKTL